MARTPGLDPFFADTLSKLLYYMYRHMYAQLKKSVSSEFVVILFKYHTWQHGYSVVGFLSTIKIK